MTYSRQTARSNTGEKNYLKLVSSANIRCQTIMNYAFHWFGWQHRAYISLILLCQLSLSWNSIFQILEFPFIMRHYTTYNSSFCLKRKTSREYIMKSSVSSGMVIFLSKYFFYCTFLIFLHSTSQIWIQNHE